jgi:hypothetical protein
MMISQPGQILLGTGIEDGRQGLRVPSLFLLGLFLLALL